MYGTGELVKQLGVRDNVNGRRGYWWQKRRALLTNSYGWGGGGGVSKTLDL